MAGPDQLGVEPYSPVLLTSADDAEATATRVWRQIAGTVVIIVDAGDGNATFEAPGSILGETLTFGYVAGNSAEDVVAISIEPVVARAARNGVEVPMRELWV
jgi:hypothetical protein